MKKLAKSKILIIIFICMCISMMTFKSQIRTKNQPYLEFDSNLIEKNMQNYLSGRWEDILLNIQFVPDDTAVVHAELERSRLKEILSLPEWIIAALPDKLEIDIQLQPYIDEKEQVSFRSVSLALNNAVMPAAVGTAVCDGIAFKINEELSKNGIMLKSIKIEGDMLKIETKKSSDQ